MKQHYTNLVLAALLVSGASASPKGASDAQLARARRLQDIPIVGIGSVTPIDGDSTAGDSSGSDAANSLVTALEQDDQVTVTSDVTLGGLVCDSLPEAEDAETLQFVISETETIVADKLFYEVLNGEVYEDKKPRKTWEGLIVDPAQADDEASPRVVSMTWAEPCDVENFLLKITSFKTDGTMSVIKSVPCDAGEPTDLCMVEMSLELRDSSSPIVPAGDESTGSPTGSPTSPPARRLRATNHHARTGSKIARRERNLQEEQTEIDVMMVYSAKAQETLGGVSHEQMATIITDAIASTNEAFVNSDINLHYRLVHVAQLPYEQQVGSEEALYELDSNAEVAAMREEYGADLVQLVGSFYDYCGIAWLYYYGNPLYGFSTVHVNCFFNYSHTHEFGHNMGAHHNREDSNSNAEYSHGMRYCTGEDPLFRTVMSYSNQCYVPVINYFSNPDVDYMGKPTGTATEDNARILEETMDTIAGWKESIVTPVPTPAPTPAPVSEPPTPDGYEYLGCFGDSGRDRVLTVDELKDEATMTTELCAEFCAGSTYFGTEFSRECFCGSSSDDYDRLGEAVCDMTCEGDSSQTCGGSNAISVYEYTDSNPSDYAGCFTDSRDRVLTGESKTNDPTMTAAVCEEFCAGAPFYGTEYGKECFCGVEGDEFDRLGESESCNIDCAGDASEICGGSYAISVYYGDTTVTTPTYLGCYTDTVNRIMTYALSDASMTTDLCETTCSESKYFGTQYGKECWCGDESTDYDQHGVSESCTIDCAGEAAETCGGRWAMSVYEY